METKSRNKRDSIEMDLEKEKLVRVLKTIKSIFEENGIFYWLDYGTLWGAIRDQKIMTYDTDIDVGVWLDEIIKIARTKKEFEKHGYELIVNPGHLNYSVNDLKTKEPLACILFRDVMNGYAVRIRFYPFMHILRISNKGFGNFITVGLWKIVTGLHKYFHIRLYYDEETSARMSDMGSFKKITFYNDTHMIPEYPERYLEWMYGSDWRENKSKDWVYYRRKQRVKEVLNEEGNVNKSVQHDAC